MPASRWGELLAGFLEFALLLFLPGFAVLTALNQVKSNGLISVIARSYGLSLALNSLVAFFLSASNVQLSSVWLEILISWLVVAVSFGVFRFRSVRPAGLLTSRMELLTLLLAAIFAVLVLSQFVKYPIFPKSYSVDFLQHFQIARIIANAGASASAGLLYYGVHYNLALGFLLVGGDAFVQIQYLMAILVAPLSLVVYEAVRQLYHNQRFAILGQILFIATGFTWYVPLYDSGLYPNLFSIILSLAYLVELRYTIEGKGVGRFLTLATIAFAIYLTHYFAPVFVIAVVISLLVAMGMRLVSMRRVGVAAIITVMPLFSLLTRPDIAGFAFSVLRGTGTTGAFTFTTPVAEYFSINPFLRYLVAEVFNYGGLLLIFALPLALYYVYRNRADAWLSFVLPIWIFILWVLAPNSELSWRFSFQALAAFVLLAPAGFHVIVNSLKWLSLEDRESQRGRRGRVRREGRSSLFEAGTLVILGLIVSAGSWTNIMANDLLSDTNSYSRAQLDLYNSMLWFAQNTPAGSSILSVTDWRVSFMQTVTGREGSLLMLASASQAVSYAKNQSYSYLLVTYFIPADVPQGFDAKAFYGSFADNKNIKMVYQNPNDVIYQVVK